MAFDSNGKACAPTSGYFEAICVESYASECFESFGLLGLFPFCVLVCRLRACVYISVHFTSKNQ